ncbi:GldG family protein [Thermodesulfobacteriota bacterium]
MIKGFRKSRLKNSTNMTFAILLILSLAIFITLLSEKHYFRWDLTITDEHTLSEKSLQVLESIKEPVAIKSFIRQGLQEYESTKRLLESYSYSTKNISYELIDPERNPAIARRYGIKAVNTLIVEGYGQTQTVKIADEQLITNALIRVSNRDTKKVCWVSGHGERSFTGSEADSFGQLKERFRKENYKFIKINLMGEDIPSDTDLLVIAAPEKRFFPVEKTSIEKYLKNGGKVLIFLEPFAGAGLEDFLKSYGIKITEDIIIDKMSRVMGGDYLLPMVANYGVHAITNGFQLTSLFSVSRSVEKSEQDSSGIKVTALAFTSSQSWSETSKSSIDAGKVQFDDNDRRGPISLAAISELDPSPDKISNDKNVQRNNQNKITGKGRLLVFGDADFASNRLIEHAGNSDFIYNSINYLVDRGDLITIRKERRPVEPLSLSRQQGRIVFLIPVVIMPLVVLLIGTFVWYRRKFY